MIALRNFSSEVNRQSVVSVCLSWTFLIGKVNGLKVSIGELPVSGQERRQRCWDIHWVVMLAQGRETVKHLSGTDSMGITKRTGFCRRKKILVKAQTQGVSMSSAVAAGSDLLASGKSTATLALLS